MTYDILISIINFRTADLTISCVKAALEDLKSVPEINGHIVIVDNLSADGSAEQIAAWIDEGGADLPVELVLSETNAGFSGGHNQGIRAGKANFYLLLNSDAVLRPGLLKQVLKTAQDTPEAGFVAPVIEYDDGGIQDSCFRFPSPLGELIRSARSGPVTRLFKRYEISLGAEPDPDEIDWASFACILLRNGMIEQIGLMDEGYFLYFEDAEYCLRARRAGWRISQNPNARVVHFRGGSGPVKSLKKERARLPRYFYSSRARFLYQAHGYTGLGLANLLWYIGRMIKHSTRLLGKRADPLPKAEGIDIWTNMFDPLGPRYAPGETYD